MRTSICAVLLTVAGLMEATNAGAQAPAPPPPPPAPPAAAPAEPPPAAPAPAAAPPAAPPPAAAPAPAAPAAPGAPAPAPPGNWWDKFSADAFVDAYGSINYNFPKPQGPIAPFSLLGGNAFRALDTAQGFSVNWAGVNVAYAADPIGFTVGLRVGPGAIAYHAGTSDAVQGLQFVKQAYATWKAADKLILDFGKWDQPYGSEVGDSQLNMNYTRSLLWWYMQPLFFTGLRANIPVSDQFNILAFVANGWNNSTDINAGKALGLQLMVKPVDMLTVYAGYVASPEQVDVAVNVPAPNAPPPTTSLVTDQGNEGHWRHLVDLVVDFNPTKELRFLLNGDFRAEDGLGPDNHSASAFGVNLVARYAFSDAFYASLRGEYFHDEHGDLLGTNVKTDAEDVTLTLAYSLGSHLLLSLDNRIDLFDNPYFYKGSDTTNTSKTQFTTTLGVVASTK